MELDGFHRKVTVAHTHDDAVFGFGGHFQTRREGLFSGEQRVVPAHLELPRKPFKDPDIPVAHHGRLAVHGVIENAQLATEGFDDTLQPGEIRIRSGAIRSIISSGKPERYVTTSAPVCRA